MKKTPDFNYLGGFGVSAIFFRFQFHKGTKFVIGGLRRSALKDGADQKRMPVNLLLSRNSRFSNEPFHYCGVKSLTPPR